MMFGRKLETRSDMPTSSHEVIARPDRIVHLCGAVAMPITEEEWGGPMYLYKKHTGAPVKLYIFEVTLQPNAQLSPTGLNSPQKLAAAASKSPDRRKRPPANPWRLRFAVTSEDVQLHWITAIECAGTQAIPPLVTLRRSGESVVSKWEDVPAGTISEQSADENKAAESPSSSSPSALLSLDAQLPEAVDGKSSPAPTSPLSGDIASHLRDELNLNLQNADEGETKEEFQPEVPQSVVNSALEIRATADELSQKLDAAMSEFVREKHSASLIYKEKLKLKDRLKIIRDKLNALEWLCTSKIPSALAEDGEPSFIQSYTQSLPLLLKGTHDPSASQGEAPTLYEYARTVKVQLDALRSMLNSCHESKLFENSSPSYLIRWMYWGVLPSILPRNAYFRADCDARLLHMTRLRSQLHQRISELPAEETMHRYESQAGALDLFTFALQPKSLARPLVLLTHEGKSIHECMNVAAAEAIYFILNAAQTSQLAITRSEGEPSGAPVMSLTGALFAIQTAASARHVAILGDPTTGTLALDDGSSSPDQAPSTRTLLTPSKYATSGHGASTPFKRGLSFSLAGITSARRLSAFMSKSLNVPEASTIQRSQTVRNLFPSSEGINETKVESGSIQSPVQRRGSRPDVNPTEKPEEEDPQMKTLKLRERRGKLFAEIVSQETAIRASLAFLHLAARIYTYIDSIAFPLAVSSACALLRVQRLQEAGSASQDLGIRPDSRANGHPSKTTQHDATAFADRLLEDLRAIENSFAIAASRATPSGGVPPLSIIAGEREGGEKFDRIQSIIAHLKTHLLTGLFQILKASIKTAFAMLKASVDSALASAQELTKLQDRPDFLFPTMKKEKLGAQMSPHDIEANDIRFALELAQGKVTRLGVEELGQDPTIFLKALQSLSTQPLLAAGTLARCVADALATTSQSTKSSETELGSKSSNLDKWIVESNPGQPATMGAAQLTGELVDAVGQLSALIPVVCSPLQSASRIGLAMQLPFVVSTWSVATGQIALCRSEEDQSHHTFQDILRPHIIKLPNTASAYSKAEEQVYEDSIAVLICGAPDMVPEDNPDENVGPKRMQLMKRTCTLVVGALLAGVDRIVTQLNATPERTDFTKSKNERQLVARNLLQSMTSRPTDSQSVSQKADKEQLTDQLIAIIRNHTDLDTMLTTCEGALVRTQLALQAVNARNEAETGLAGLRRQLHEVTAAKSRLFAEQFQQL